MSACHLRPVRARAALVGATLVACAGACGTRTVDVGRNDPVSTSPTHVEDAGLVTSQYGCPAWKDDEIRALRGATCTGACADDGGTAYALGSQTELVAATAGQWLFCAPPPFAPTGAIGIELAPGCRIFFLQRDASGAIVRGTSAAYQASFDIYDLTDPTAPRRVDLHLPDGTTQAWDVRATACPSTVDFTPAGAAKATVRFASDFGDAGRPDPVK